MNSLPADYLLSEAEYQELSPQEKEDWVLVSTCGCKQD